MLESIRIEARTVAGHALLRCSCFVGFRGSGSTAFFVAVWPNIFLVVVAACISRFRCGHPRFGFGSLPRLTAVGGVDELVDIFLVVDVACGSVVVMNVSSWSLVVG